MIARYVQTLFCDDIRHELGGKLSYIGVYSGGLFVTSFPITLPKLCLSVQVVTPGEKPMDSLTLRVLKDEEVLQEIVVDEAQLSAASVIPEEMTDDERNERLQLAHFMLVFSPIQFEAPCVLRVRALTGDEELHGVALKVDQVQAADNVSLKKETEHKA